MEGRIHHVAYCTAREYAKDGYKLDTYEFSEEVNNSWYSLVHDNGNRIDVHGIGKNNVVQVVKNGKLNKEIKLKK